ncbi:MAG: hypothetical protein IT267_10830 [Saprospiraceae bacterium]|nr:hypothetical protein [Saprospiraceae bacterium]
MTLRNQLRVIVYRIHEKGLEVLLVHNHIQENTYHILKGPDLTNYNLNNDISTIEINSTDDLGQVIKAIAIEGDWHDIPKIRTLLKNDLYIVKEKVKDVLPEVTQGTYVAIKDAFKKVLPNEYAILKELKEIILDRNALRNI